MNKDLVEADVKLINSKLEKMQKSKPKKAPEVNLENESNTVVDAVSTYNIMADIPKDVLSEAIGTAPSDKQPKFMNILESKTSSIFFNEFGKLNSMEQQQFMEAVNKAEAIMTQQAVPEVGKHLAQQKIEASDSSGAANILKRLNQARADVADKESKTSITAKNIAKTENVNEEEVDSKLQEILDVASDQFNGVLNTYKDWFEKGKSLWDTVGQAMYSPIEKGIDYIAGDKEKQQNYAEEVIGTHMKQFIENNSDELKNLNEKDLEKVLTKELKRFQKIYADRQGLELSDISPITDSLIGWGAIKGLTKAVTGGTATSFLTKLGLFTKEVPLNIAAIGAIENENLSGWTKAGAVVASLFLGGASDDIIMSAVKKSQIRNIIVNSSNPTDEIMSTLLKQGKATSGSEQEMGRLINKVLTDDSLSTNQQAKILSLFGSKKTGLVLANLSNEQIYKGSKASKPVRMIKTDSPTGETSVDAIISKAGDLNGVPSGKVFPWEMGDLAKGANLGKFGNEARIANSTLDHDTYMKALKEAKSSKEISELVSGYFRSAGRYIIELSDQINAKDLQKVLDESTLKVSAQDNIFNSLEQQGARHFLIEHPSFLEDIGKGISGFTTRVFNKALKTLPRNKRELLVEILERGDEEKVVYRHKDLVREAGEDVARSYRIIRNLFDETREYTNKVYRRMANKKGYKQTTSGDVVKPLAKKTKDSSKVAVRSVMTGTKYEIDPNNLGNVREVVRKIEGYVPWRRSGKYDIYELDHDKGTYTHIATASKNSESIEILKRLYDAPGRGSNISYARVKAGTTPTVTFKTPTNDFETVMYKMSKEEDSVEALRRLGLSADEISKIQRQPLAKIRGTKKKAKELKSLSERFADYSQELGRVVKDDYISSLQEAFIREYGKYLKDEKKWYSPIKESLTPPGSVQRNIKYIQNQIRLSLNMPTRAVENTQHRINNFLTASGTDPNLGVFRKAVNKGIEKMVPSVNDRINEIKMLSAVAKLGFSAVHYMLQPMHMFQTIFADPKAIPRVTADINSLFVDKIGRSLGIPLPKFITKNAEDFRKVLSESQMRQSVLTTDAPIVGSNSIIQKIQKAAVAPLTGGESINKYMAASVGRRMADKLSLTGAKKTQFIREYGNRYALDLGTMSSPALSRGYSSITVGQFSRYFLQQYDLLFRRMTPIERFHTVKAMYYLGGLQGIPIVSDITEALEYHSRDIGELYYEYGQVLYPALMYTFYEKMKYNDSYDIGVLKELGYTDEDLEHLKTVRSNKEYKQEFDVMKEQGVHEILKDQTQGVIGLLQKTSSVGGVLPEHIVERMMYAGFAFEKLYGTWGWTSNFGAIISSLAQGDTIKLMQHLGASVTMGAKDPMTYLRLLNEKTRRAFDEVFSAPADVVESLLNITDLVASQDWTREEVRNLKSIADFLSATEAELVTDDRFQPVPWNSLTGKKRRDSFSFGDAALNLANINDEESSMFYKKRSEWQRTMDKFKNEIDYMAENLAVLAVKGNMDEFDRWMAKYAMTLEAVFGDVPALSGVVAQRLHTQTFKEVNKLRESIDKQKAEMWSKGQLPDEQ